MADAGRPPPGGVTGQPHSHSQRLLILAGDVTWHLGDRFIQHALAHLLRAALPEAELHCSGSARRDRGEAPPGALREPPPLTLLRAPRRLREFDGVVWGGGQLLQDNASLLKNPYWAFVLAAIRRRVRGPLIGLGIGAGPLDTRWGRFFARRALRQLDALVVRDPTSRALLTPLWPAARPPLKQLPDPAVALSAAAPEIGERYLQETAGVPPVSGDLRIGIALQPWHDARRRLRPAQWTGPRGAVGAERLGVRMRETLAAALNAFAASRPARGLFFPLYTAPWEGDDRESAAVAAQLRMPAHVLRMQAAPAALKAAAGRCDVFLSFRLHGAALSMGAGVPTVGVAQSAKVAEFFAAAGQADLCLPAADLHAPGGGARLLAALENLERNRARISGELRAVNAAWTAQCADYGRLLRDTPRCGRRPR